ncbi:hypothetical protein RIVM261_071660 [Rivularia sp. IAM M-261]|nr:hypothetical protein RIVM261_071660 [Rivularia sp. IAM M-261]
MLNQGISMTNTNNTPKKFQRELIVVVKPEAGVRATREGVSSIAAANVNPIAELLSSENATMRPLFGLSEERMQARTASLATQSNADVPDLSVYYKIDAPDERLEEIAARLREQEIVEAAYVKPAPELPIALSTRNQTLNIMQARTQEVLTVTPDFSSRQTYLDAAPNGIDARYAWTIPGGSGDGVQIIDIEGDWHFSHEDLLENQGGIIGGSPANDLDWRNHGTAVVGVLGCDLNSYGCTGICPDASVRAISIFNEQGYNYAAAIRQAADALNPGDIILIELQARGPRATGNGQEGLVAIEWWPDDFDVIRYATSKGIIVIEAAGNGAEDLDDPIYDIPFPGFPSNWSNPFNRVNRDSGAIIVGAGAPPPNTHGRNHGPDRSRLEFSNYGSAIDAQGWGSEVTTCGYGDLQGGINEDEWYTDKFSGTSSASPIVVGAVACVQGVLRALGMSPLTPGAARDLLRSTGSPQQDAPGRPNNQRIGNRPDVREMIANLLGDNRKVVIYSDSEYRGISQELEPGIYDLDQLTIGNDTLSSLRVPPGMLTILYEQPGFTGQSKEFSSDTTYVGDDFNDKTSSLEILVL